MRSLQSYVANNETATPAIVKPMIKQLPQHPASSAFARWDQRSALRRGREFLLAMMSRDGWGTLVFSSSAAQHSRAADADTVERFEHNTLCRSRPTGKSEAKADQFRHILLVMASAQPLSAFALVESALLTLSGDGGIFNRCLEYLGDTPTVIMGLLDGEADDGEEDGSTGAAGSIWSHDVSFMDAFTLASLDMTCRDAYFADSFKTADRWVEWDQMQFEFATNSPTVFCQYNYVDRNWYSRLYVMPRHTGPDLVPIAFERDGKSRYRILNCASDHLSLMYLCDIRMFNRGPGARVIPEHRRADFCHCPIGAAMGAKCGWRKIPVRCRQGVVGCYL